MWPIERYDVTGPRHSSLRRLQSGNAAIMGRQTDATAGIGSQFQRCAAGGQNRRGPAAATTRGSVQIEWVVSAAIDEIVCFKPHRNFGSVSLSQQDCAGSADTSHRGCIFCWDE